MPQNATKKRHPNPKEGENGDYLFSEIDDPAFEEAITLAIEKIMAGSSDLSKAATGEQTDNLSKLLVLETALEYLIKAVPGEKLEYLKPGEKAPRGIQVQRGSRGGRGYYPSEVTAVEEETAVLEPTEERELEVIAPEDPDDGNQPTGGFTDPSFRRYSVPPWADDEAAEQDDSTSNQMESPNAVNEYLAVVADKLETRLEEIVGEEHQSFLGKKIPLSNLTADYITKVGYTDGSEEGASYPSGLGIHSYENFTVTIESGFLGRQKQQFIYKMVKGESRGELLSYAVDRVLGLNVVPFVRQHSMDFFMLSDKLKRTHGEEIHKYQLQELRLEGVGGNAGGHFQEFCSNCVSRDELYPTMTKMLSTEKGREEFFKVMLLDYITGNDDRHTGNYLITEDEKIVAIDSGFAGGGASSTNHQKQASLDLRPDRRFELTFPYGIGNEMGQRYPDIVLTVDDIKDEAGKFFDKYFDRGKLDAVLESINWTSTFREGGFATGHDIEDSEQMRARFKDNFINVAAENMRVGLVGWSHDDASDYDRTRSGSVKPRLSVLKRELATEGINIDVMHSLGFDGNPMIDESEPNIHEEDEFN